MTDDVSVKDVATHLNILQTMTTFTVRASVVKSRDTEIPSGKAFALTGRPVFAHAAGSGGCRPPGLGLLRRLRGAARAAADPMHGRGPQSPS